MSERRAADVAIAGGGVIGLSCALALAEAGADVTVCDRGPLGQEASWAGAGIIPPGRPDRAATPLDLLRAYGAQQFPVFAEAIRQRTGIDIGYRRCGGIEFLSADLAAEIVPLWQKEGIEFARLDAAQLRELEPAVRPPAATAAYRLPGYAQIRNPWLLRGLTAACQQMGVRLYPEAAVVGWDGPPGPSRRVTAFRLADGSPLTAQQFLLTTGAWTDFLLQQLGGPSLGIHPVRGQIVLLKTPRPVVRHILLMDKRYIVPRDDGHVLIGSTEEPEAGFVKANTAAAVAELLAFGTALVPALTTADLVRCWSGLRPGSPLGEPVIGPLPPWENVYVAAGHFRAGIQLSLGTARLVAEWLGGGPRLVSADAFRPARPVTDPAPRAFRS